jgi:competence protein ComEC
VGEGQALFLQQGREAILVDTGHAGLAGHVLERLKHYGVDSLRAVILTHLHPDHASGWFRIHEAFPGVTVLDNGQPLPEAVSPDMVRWVRDSLRGDPHHQTLTIGDQLDWGRLRLEVLWPHGFSGHNLNLHSLVLLVTIGKSRVLIMGDAPQAVERRLLKAGGLPKQVDVLVVGHHGAADSSSTPFLQRLTPRYSVISVNADNLRGYPDADTLKRLKHYSTRVYRTDVDGEVCLVISGQAGGVGPCPGKDV